MGVFIRVSPKHRQCLELHDYRFRVDKRMVTFAGLRMRISRKQNPDYFGGADPDSTSTGGNAPPVRIRDYTVPQQKNAKTVAIAKFAPANANRRLDRWSV